MNQPRVTIRCLEEDLCLPLPPLTEVLAPKHELYERVVEYAPTAPAGLEPIGCIPGRKVGKIKTSRWRGAAWVDESKQVFWLLAGALRRQGDSGDAYEHFEGLYRSDRLYPVDDDYVRLRAEAVARFNAIAADAIRSVLDAAKANCGQQFDVLLAGWLPMRIVVRLDDTVQEVWIAVSVLDKDGEGVSKETIQKVFAITELQLSDDFEWEPRSDWLGEPLDWWIVARYGLGPRE